MRNSECGTANLKSEIHNALSLPPFNSTRRLPTDTSTIYSQSELRIEFRIPKSEFRTPSSNPKSKFRTSKMSEPSNTPEERIDDLSQRSSALADRCFTRSAQRLCRETKQIAKTERLVIPYLYANHRLMNHAQSLLEPDFGIETAIESIALLESEERARQIQADLPEGRYEHLVHSMSSCAYDNLAKHIAQRDGYNSNGVHDCIADGIQVCRRTGKLQCISCFREYATDVYIASDDLEMAHHHAMAVMQIAVKEDDFDGTDRRWVGAKDLAWISLLEGRLETAISHFERVFELAKSYHSPFEANIDSVNALEQALLLAGRIDELDAFLLRHNVARDIGSDIPKGEYPVGDISIAERDAIALCCGGNYAEAADVLTEFDQLATRQKCLNQWFRMRVQLIAIYLLAGDKSRAERLGAQLEEKAKPARDWLRMRQIKSLLQGDVALSPLGQPTSFKVGPFAHKTQVAGIELPTNGVGVAATESPIPSSESNPEVTESQTSNASTVEHDAAATASAANAPVAKSKLTLVLESTLDEFNSHQDDPEQEKLVAAKLFRITIDDFADAEDARRALHVTRMLANQTDQQLQAWKWCESFIERFADDAVFVNMYAGAAFAARESEQLAERGADQILSLDAIEDLFRRSLDLDPEHAQNFARAGQFYLSSERAGDAEQCFARGFRLARDNSPIAMHLSDIYADSDRLSDALNVLDMCIRERCDDPAVYWQAAMLGIRLGRFQIVVSYLEEYDRLSPDDRWTHYYLALAHVETNRPAEALKSLDIERPRSGDSVFGIEVLQAAALSQQNDIAALKTQLDRVLAIPLKSVDYMTRTGIVSMVERLFAIVGTLDANDEHRQRVTRLGLQSGLAPEEFFAVSRRLADAVENVGFYICTFEQPLDASWSNHAGCLYGEDDWPSYVARWGVLALSADEAESLARHWQDECYSKPAELLSVDIESGGYQDRIGVVWQSAHFHPDELVDDDAIDDEFDDEFEDEPLSNETDEDDAFDADPSQDE